MSASVYVIADPTRAEKRREVAAALHLVLACLIIALGGVLLGLQVDGEGHLAGTGHTALGVGALVALVASLLQAAAGAGRLPRDGISVLSAVCSFLGLAFIVAGVIAPGGRWMFIEVFLLLWMLSRRRSRHEAGAGLELTGGSLMLLGLMLLFRLWITYQGSEHQWELVTIPVPFLSSLPFPFLEPIQSIDLGSFRPEELGFPPTGLDFPLTTTLWGGGFALCAAGLWWRFFAAGEHECDRIHATIHLLPPALAVLVEKLLPEEEWEELGLFGLSERRLCKRIEALVRERIALRAELHAAISAADLSLPEAVGFAGEIHGAIGGYLETAKLPPAKA